VYSFQYYIYIYYKRLNIDKVRNGIVTFLKHECSDDSGVYVLFIEHFYRVILRPPIKSISLIGILITDIIQCIPFRDISVKKIFPLCWRWFDLVVIYSLHIPLDRFLDPSSG